jgi:hypothetical protein
VTTIPDAGKRILRDGVLCYLAAPSPAGPHTTPVVFAVENGRVWGTTGRGTTKAKLWRREPTAGGMVRSGGRTLVFRGPVTLYDALDPSTWMSSMLRGVELTLASAKFTAKNARFFAGYARDVARVPLSWTPPARVVFSVDVASGVILEGASLVERWGSWGSDVGGQKTFRRAASGFQGEELPEEVRELLATPREAVVALPHPEGPVVVPGRASTAEGSMFARLPGSLVELAGTRPPSPAAVVMDHASAWRAAKMRGLMLRGPASTFVPGSLTAGRSSLEAAVGEELDDTDAVVRVRPRTAVWWSGWASGTVTAS